jgi:hypothetical protein
MDAKVRQTSALVIASVAYQIDRKKSTSIRCDGFPYFRSKGVERCGSVVWHGCSVAIWHATRTRIVGLMGLEFPRAKWYFLREVSASLVKEARHEAVPFLARPDYGHRGCFGR